MTALKNNFDDQTIKLKAADDINEKYDTAEAQITNLEAQIADQKQKLSDLESFKKSFQEKETIDQKEVNEKDEKIKSLEKELKDLDKRTGEMLYNQRLESNNMKLNDKNEIAELKKQALEQTVNNDGLMAENQKIIEKNDMLVKKITELEKSESNNKSKIEELSVANKKLEQETLNSGMKLLKSPSASRPNGTLLSTDQPSQNTTTVSTVCVDSHGNPMSMPALEKEIKRLRSRNDRMLKAMNDTNDKNRAFQTKLKKYYGICEKAGLLAKKAPAGGGNSEPLKENNGQSGAN